MVNRHRIYEIGALSDSEDEIMEHEVGTFVNLTLSLSLSLLYQQDHYTGHFFQFVHIPFFMVVRSICLNSSPAIPSPLPLSRFAHVLSVSLSVVCI
jgi:hypothetical protein